MTPELWLTPAMWLVTLFAEFVIMALLLAWTIWKRIKAEMRVRELEEGMPDGSEYWLIDLNGNRIQLDPESVKHVYDHNGKLVGYEATYETSTPERQAEMLMTGQVEE